MFQKSCEHGITAHLQRVIAERVRERVLLSHGPRPHLPHTHHILDEMIRMVDLDGIGKIGLGEWQRVLTTSAITSEMIAIKCASERTKKDMEALANAGVENLALAQQAQDAKKKEAREKRATATAKSEKQDLQKNYCRVPPRVSWRRRFFLAVGVGFFPQLFLSSTLARGEETFPTRFRRLLTRVDLTQNRRTPPDLYSPLPAILRQFAVAPNQLKKYYERFIQIDRDGSGSITYEEFCLVLEDEDSELLRSLFDIFDLDGSGALEMIEFIVGLSSYCTGTTNEERMKFAFMICDSDQSGQLDREMISKILSAMFLAQQCSPADVKRRTDKIFSISGSRDFITYPQSGSCGGSGRKADEFYINRTKRGGRAFTSCLARGIFPVIILL